MERFNFIIYLIKNTDCNINNHFIINSIPSDIDILIDFTLFGTIFNKSINLFNSIYSNILMKKIYDKILEWCKLLMLFTDSINNFYINTSKQNIINNQIFFINKKPESIIYNNPDNNFKVHINVRLESIFYVLHVLLSNNERFKNILHQFKIDISFCGFNISNQFTNRESCCNSVRNNYYVEEEQPVNFVLYPIKDDTFNSTGIQTNVRDIINILKANISIEDKKNLFELFEIYTNYEDLTLQKVELKKEIKKELEESIKRYKIYNSYSEKKHKEFDNLLEELKNIGK
jgi:predicted nucleotidyltransferase